MKSPLSCLIEIFPYGMDSKKISDISSKSKINISSTLVNLGCSNTGTASSKSASDTRVSSWCFVGIKSVENSRSVVKRFFLTP